MSSKGVSPMRSARVNPEIYVAKKLPEKGRMLVIDQFYLGSIEKEKRLMQKIFQDHGPGKYSLTIRTNNRFDSVWLGWLEEVGNEILVKARMKEGDWTLKNHLNEKLGLDELEYSNKGQVSISKKGGA